MKTHLITLLKGAWIGGTMMVPGVSGGTMAIILGIYDRLISSISSFFKDIKRNFFFLLVFVIGAGLGMILFSKPLEWILESYYQPAMFFFIGAVCGGIPLMIERAKIKKFSLSIPVYFIIGAAAMFAITLLPTDLIRADEGMTFQSIALLFIAGIITAVALVLPGISTSYMLLLLGVYDKILSAISNFDILTILPLVLGVGVGIIATTRFLETLMNKFPTGTYIVILGFIFTSVVDVFPGFPSGLELVISILLFCTAFLSFYLLGKRFGDD